ncbi:MAG TPA: hypothetical protein VL688_06015 [Verrucomicrobiae bacterium]|jgi:hypothetical protein|nr:hypothetical protein [Verrucomicrobiae bacterium]
MFTMTKKIMLAMLLFSSCLLIGRPALALQTTPIAPENDPAQPTTTAEKAAAPAAEESVQESGTVPVDGVQLTSAAADDQAPADKPKSVRIKDVDYNVADLLKNNVVTEQESINNLKDRAQKQNVAVDDKTVFVRIENDYYAVKEDMDQTTFTEILPENVELDKLPVNQNEGGLESVPTPIQIQGKDPAAQYDVIWSDNTHFTIGFYTSDGILGYAGMLAVDISGSGPVTATWYPETATQVTIGGQTYNTADLTIIYHEGQLLILDGDLTLATFDVGKPAAPAPNPNGDDVPNEADLQMLRDRLGLPPQVEDASSHALSQGVTVGNQPEAANYNVVWVQGDPTRFSVAFNHEDPNSGLSLPTAIVWFQLGNSNEVTAAWPSTVSTITLGGASYDISSLSYVYHDNQLFILDGDLTLITLSIPPR